VTTAATARKSSAVGCRPLGPHSDGRTHARPGGSRPSGGCCPPTPEHASSCSPSPRTWTAWPSRSRPGLVLSAQGRLARRTARHGHPGPRRPDMALAHAGCGPPRWVPRRRSPRVEIQVLEGMSHGRSNAEIGRELSSEDTVRRTPGGSSRSSAPRTGRTPWHSVSAGAWSVRTRSVGCSGGTGIPAYSWWAGMAKGPTGCLLLVSPRMPHP